MFAHVRQPSSQILFSYCAFESSISGAQRMRTPGGHGTCTEWRGGAWRIVQLRWWADRTPTIASQTVALLASLWLVFLCKVKELTFLTTGSSALYYEQWAKLCLSKLDNFSFFLSCTDGKPLEWQNKRGLQPTEPAGEEALHRAAEIPNGHRWHSAPPQSQWSQEHVGWCQ